jgi:hypothetical protein
MPTYYVDTSEPTFTDEMVKRLEERGWKKSTSMPVDFIFLEGEHSYYRNKFDTQKSGWISRLYGHSVDTLCNKVELHKHFADAPFLVPTQFLRDSIPTLSRVYPKILKPLGGFSGTGIRLIQTKDEIAHWIGTHREYTEWMLQPYLKHPALRNGYKFHLRVLVLVKTHPIEAYIARRMFYVPAMERYVSGEWDNARIHDTHYRPGKIEVFPDILPDEWSERDAIKAIREIQNITHHILKGQTGFKPIWNAKRGFEVFGMDILFDKKKPYLLEFNNKMSLKGRASYGEGIIRTVLGEDSTSYFTRIL